MTNWDLPRTRPREILQIGFRQEVAKLPPDPLQRIAFFNASDLPFDGYAEYEPWTQWRKWPDGWRLLDERGENVPLQTMQAEAVSRHITDGCSRACMPARARRGF